MVKQNKCCYTHQSHGRFESRVMKDELKLIKRASSKLLSLFCLCFLSCCLTWLSPFYGFPFSPYYILCENPTKIKDFLYEKVEMHVDTKASSKTPISSTAATGVIYCDRSHFRTDTCYVKGDIRTNASSSSIILYTQKPNPNASLLSPLDQEEQELRRETIKPYTRKWETSVMNTIDQLHLISKYKPLMNSGHKCDVFHDIPAIFFSTGGYTGNVYHEFNDGLIPLFITSHHFNKEVIFVILEYHEWWYTKYAQILSQLSNYPLINFYANPRKARCFKEAIVGLKIHNELTIDPSLTQGSKTILDFRNLLTQAFEPNLSSTNPIMSSMPRANQRKKPKLVLLSRKGSRSITNERSLVRLAQKLGFKVQILKPNRNTELSNLYMAISTSNVLIGVHGAAMTHFLFLKAGSILIQVIPLGTEWASETYYGEPAKKFGLKYTEYKIDPKESSLYNKYDKNDPVLRDPRSINEKGWEFTKRIYLEGQNVTLDLNRFKLLLSSAYNASCLPQFN